MTATTVGTDDPIAAGNAALRNGAWEEARALFEAAVAAGGGAEGLEGLSRALWWLGDEEGTLGTRERAYRAYQEAGDACGAARMAMWLASDNLDFRGEDAIASAWLQRGRDLLRDHEPCAELGYITLVEADVAQLARSDPATAERKAREALELAREIGDVGVEVVSLALLGCALAALGAVDEGLESIERGAALAVGEEFAEIAAPAWALCHTVSMCAEVGDFQRAAQWCRALHTFSATWQARQFFGICRTAYGEVLATGGDWPAAEQELETALEDMRTTRSALAAPTAVRLGRLRMRQGNTAVARALFEGALPLPPRSSRSASSISRGATRLRPRRPPTAPCAASARPASSTASLRWSCSRALARALATPSARPRRSQSSRATPRGSRRRTCGGAPGSSQPTCSPPPVSTTPLARPARTRLTCSPPARRRMKRPRRDWRSPRRSRRWVGASAQTPRRGPRTRRSPSSARSAGSAGLNGTS